MARKTRDYKAEYAGTKSRATSAGYKSEREYKAVRKALKLPRGVSPAPRAVVSRAEPEKLSNAQSEANRIGRIRRANRKWSEKHSRRKTSAYSPKFSDEKAEEYHAAFVESITVGGRRANRTEKRRRLYNYLVPDYLNDKEWESKYPAGNSH